MNKKIEEFCTQCIEEVCAQFRELKEVETDFFFLAKNKRKFIWGKSAEITLLGKMNALSLIPTVMKIVAHSVQEEVLVTAFVAYGKLLRKEIKTGETSKEVNSGIIIIFETPTHSKLYVREVITTKTGIKRLGKIKQEDWEPRSSKDNNLSYFNWKDRLKEVVEPTEDSVKEIVKELLK